MEQGGNEQPDSVIIGHVRVTPTAFETPAGSGPLAGTEWTCQERLESRRLLPWWLEALRSVSVLLGALGAATIGVLVRRASQKRPEVEVPVGVVEVNLRSTDFSYGTSCTVENALQLDDIRARIAWIQAWAAAQSA